jgi:hypothetical protein
MTFSAKKIVLSGLLSGGTISGLYIYSTSENSNATTEQSPNKCKVFLDRYVECMTIHENKAPRPYELEWCTEEKELYNDCMDEIRKEREKDL